MAIVPLDFGPKVQVNCSSTIYVDQSGRGNFQSIQAAVDSVPPNNLQWICINVKQGVYKERVFISRERTFIYMVGDGLRQTQIVSNGTDPIDATATLITHAANIIIQGISFINSYNYPAIGSPNPMTQAVAAKIEGDKTAFYECGFYGLQDTLWDQSGRHYFKDCIIEGAVDFIFGAGQSIYESCVISVVGEAIGSAGFITAQSRQSPEETSGFVFKYCNVSGNGKTYLGRPWRKYARVIYYNTYMSNIIVPEGWAAASSTGQDQGLLTFVDNECFGPGANTSGRPKWANKLSTGELQKFVSINYINSDGWLLSNTI
ncbi:pectinesterase [Salvia divinorum]|uniref:Pectinesterase n=1 Tax=Salvia divinorum TaxID=28513 RepID=A0ABD1HA84_SALDI